jgi:sugar lactone lactonase YvrE
MIRRHTAPLSRLVWWPLAGSHILIALIGLIAWAGSATIYAQEEEAFIAEVRVFDIDDIDSLSPAGLAFSPGANQLLVWQAADGAQSQANGSTLLAITPLEELAATLSVAAAVADPINMAFDSKANRLLIYDAAKQELIEIKAGEDGVLAPETLRRHNAQPLKLQRASGMSVEPSTGTLFILDSSGPRLVRVEPDANGNFDEAKVSLIDLQGTGIANGRGLALHPTTGHLHIADANTQTLYELSQDGKVVSQRDLSDLELGKIQGMVFAPSGDLTDDPGQINLYLADSQGADGALGGEQFVPRENQVYMPHITGGSGNGSKQAIGRLVELTFTQPVVVAAAEEFTSQLVRTVDMSNWNPPSPDPSGLAYLGGNRLIMVDGEVEEKVGGITHFEGANVWEFTLSGSVIRSTNISTVQPTNVPMTDEPTGVAWDPDTGIFYITNDGKKRVYILDPGNDGLIGTTDDSFSFFSTTANNNTNTDPEGIAFGYNGGQPRVWVADGTNREVYEYTLTGTLVSHFDTAGFGVDDPESVEYNPDSGTLFVMSSQKPKPKKGLRTLIVETDLDGTPLKIIDISVINAQQAAGLAYAPASDGSGAKRFYIVNRGIDNDSDPHIIDGVMYEMTAPSSSTPPPPTNQPPNAVNDSASTAMNTAVNINVVSNDTDPNGNLNPNSVTVTAPPSNGSVTNNGNGVLQYTPNNNFTGTDTFPYQVCDTNNACDTATVTVTVTNTPPPPGGDLIFADGFESGNLSAWTSNTTDGGDLSVTTAAALVGGRGLQAVIDDNVSIFVTDDTPDAESRYRARFYFDPNSITMENGDNHFIFYAYRAEAPKLKPADVVLRIQLRKNKNGYQLRAALRNDANTWSNSAWFTISDTPHAIEIDWQSAPNNGSLTLWIDDLVTPKATITGVNNGTRRIERVILGAVAGIDNGTRGTYYIDAFESRRENAIGPAAAVVASLEAAFVEQASEPELTFEPSLYLPFLDR